MELYLYNLQYYIILFSIMFLFLLIIIGIFNFDYVEFGRPEYPTVSDIIARVPVATVIYGLIVSTYAFSKVLMLFFYIITKRKYKNIIVVFNIIHVTGFLLVGMIYLTKMYTLHYVIASITFGSAVVRSWFMYWSRMYYSKNTPDEYTYIDTTELNMNFMYVLSMTLLLFIMSIEIHGFCEVIFIIFVLTENVFQIFDYRNHTITFNVNPIYDPKRLTDVEFKEFKYRRLTRSIRQVEGEMS